MNLSQHLIEIYSNNQALLPGSKSNGVKMQCYLLNGF